MIDISVIIPACNSSSTIDRCLSALERQTFKPLEIIVVDDNSNDDTVTIASRYASVIKNSRSKGAGGTRNTGAFAAKGSILAFLDSDCVPPENWLEKIYLAFKFDDIGAVAGGYSGHEGSSFIGHFADAELYLRRKNFSSFIRTAASNNFAVRAGLFHKADGFPEMFAGATLEDMALSFNIGRYAKIKWLPDNSVGHYYHDTVMGYLKQQYSFGRDTVVLYYTMPELAGTKTHQGRMIYIETLLSGLTICSLLQPWPWFVLLILSLIIINVRLLNLILNRSGLMTAVKAGTLIPVRDFIWVLSVISGFAKIVFYSSKPGSDRFR